MKQYADIRRRVDRVVEKAETKRMRRTYPKPGTVFSFRYGQLVHIARAAAPFLPSSPIVNGVRMRYEKGRLVPRVSK